MADEMVVQVAGHVTHLRAHGKRLIFLDVEQAESGGAIELLVKESALETGPIPTLGVGDVIAAAGSYDKEDSKHGAKLLKCSSITVVKVSVFLWRIMMSFLAIVSLR